MRKLPLSWIAVGALGTFLQFGCVSVGRYSALPTIAKRHLQDVSEHHASDRAEPQEYEPRGQWNSVDPDSRVGSGGVYIAGGNTKNGWPATVGSIGGFHLPSEWSTVRYGVFGLDNNGIGVGGIEGGIRLHAPSRLTPYVGLSGDLGFSSLHSGISHNPYNNPKYPPNGAHITKPTGLLAIVPEAGVSYWLNSSTRLNAGASYYVTDDRHDFLVFGLSLEFLSWDASDFSGNSSLGRASRSPRFTDSRGISSGSVSESGPYFVGSDGFVDRPKLAEAIRDHSFDNVTRTFATVEEIDHELSSQASVSNAGALADRSPGTAFNGTEVETHVLKPAPDDSFAPIVARSHLFGSALL